MCSETWSASARGTAKDSKPLLQSFLLNTFVLHDYGDAGCRVMSDRSTDPGRSRRAGAGSGRDEVELNDNGGQDQQDWR